MHRQGTVTRPKQTPRKDVHIRSMNIGSGLLAGNKGFLPREKVVAKQLLMVNLS
jgi:hypothetical protein